MVKINKESLSVFKNPDDLIDYIALHRFEPENNGLLRSDEFKELPGNIADVIYVLDFEMIFNAVGLFDSFANIPLDIMGNIIQSFDRTGNENISKLLQQAVQIVSLYDIPYEKLREDFLKRAESEDEDVEEVYIELKNNLSAIEEGLYSLMEETDYWDNVKSNL